jgi:hypothetical protein
MSDDAWQTDDPNLELGLERVLELEIDVESPIEIGDTGNGQRRIIPITGGTVTGWCEGTVLAVGADYQLYRDRRPTELVAKYAFETDDGDRVYVENRGMRVADPETKRKLRDGEEVDPDAVYFCSVPEFEVASPELSWLEEHVFVAAGTRQPNGVRLAVYKVG